MVSYQRVDNIKNISLHEDVFASLFRSVDKKIPGDKTSHPIRSSTECTESDPALNWASRGTHDVEGTEEQDIKRILGN